MREPDPIAAPAGSSADPHYAMLRRMRLVPTLLDLRDHVVLAGAIGLAAGSADPIRDGADDIVILSGAILARWPEHTFHDAAAIVSAPKPFGLRLPKWASLYGREAALNLCIWRDLLLGPGPALAPPAVVELFIRVSSLVAPASGRGGAGR